MNVVKPEATPPPQEPVVKAPLAGTGGSAILSAADSVAQFTTRFPAVSVVCAFAMGFAIARVVRSLGSR